MAGFGSPSSADIPGSHIEAATVTTAVELYKLALWFLRQADAQFPVATAS